MAPEVVLGIPYSSKADSWSIGVLLFIMLTGQPPFKNSGATAEEALAGLLNQSVCKPVELDHSTLELRFLPIQVYDFLCKALDKDQTTRPYP